MTRTILLAVTVLTLDVFALNVPKPKASNGRFDAYVQVSWSKVKSASEYVIYRGTSSIRSQAVELTRIEANKKNKRSYKDYTAVRKGVYYYWVEVVDSDGQRWSDTAKCDSGYRKKLVVPKPNASDGKYAEYVRVKWKAVKNAAGYAVYRGTVADFSYAVRIGSFGQGVVAVLDYGAQVGVKYYYWVCPVDSEGNEWSASGKSNKGYLKIDLKVDCTAKMASGYAQSYRVTCNGKTVYPDAVSWKGSAIEVSLFDDLEVLGYCGKISALKKGSATVYVTYRGKVAAQKITVRKATSSSNGYVAGPASLVRTHSGTYSLIVDGKQVNADVKWRSAGTSITVYDQGSTARVVAGNPPKDGFKTAIEATYKGKSYKKTIVLYK